MYGIHLHNFCLHTSGFVSIHIQAEHQVHTCLRPSDLLVNSLFAHEKPRLEQVSLRTSDNCSTCEYLLSTGVAALQRSSAQGEENGL